MSRLIAFWSPSGAGATTLLLNSAAALGARRANLAAADLNLVAPTLALAADLLPHDRPLAACACRLLPLLESGRLSMDEVHQSLLFGQTFAVLPGILDVVAASRVAEGHVRQLLQVLSSRYDLVLADVTPALDSVGCLPVLEMADQVILVTGPDLASRFHTRRHLLPVRAMGLADRCRLVLNRSGGTAPVRIAQDVGLDLTLAVPDLRLMPGLVEAGQIAYLSQAPHPALARFRTAVDELASLLAQGG
jgi:MinD-like ATPase involved in chromosome partitioning or flagellar assembly